MEFKKLGETPPVTQEMRRVLDVPALSVQQTLRGCFQECLGCEAKTEYKVYHGHLEEGQARDMNIPQVGHLLEESNCLLRCCCSASRPFTMPFSVPGSVVEGGTTLLEFNKGWNLPICCLIPTGEGDPLQCPCCCFLPSLETYVVDGSSRSLVGSSAYLCDEKLFVPKFMVSDYTGAPKYLIRPDTCCFDCCATCRFDPGNRRASRMMYIPFFVRPRSNRGRSQRPSATHSGAGFGADPRPTYRRPATRRGGRRRAHLEGVTSTDLADLR